MPSSTRPAETRPPESTAPRRREEFYATPFGVGRLVLAGDLPVRHSLPDPAAPRSRRGGAERWCELLERYFAGERVAFPLDVESFIAYTCMTAFEASVIRALARVPYGRTASYRDLAVAAGRPYAYRAAASVVARNELPVVLPCHRIVRSDGSLGQYGDDPAWKRRLLEIEGVDVDAMPKEGRR